MSRRCKIAATLGPASADETVLRRIVDAGLDLARLNFSHGDEQQHRRHVRLLRKVAKQSGRVVGLLADLQGPRFRVGVLPEGELTLEEGQAVDLLAGRNRAPAGVIPVSHRALAKDVRRDQPVLIDDGNVRLLVERVRENRIRCRVLRGGVVTDRKGINLPGTDLSVPTITAKDRRDLKQAVGMGADWLAVSFVRSAADVRQARKLLARAGSDIPVMAKIERPEAIDRLDEIVREADGVLVARGDLSVELATEDVPILQKQIIEAANADGKPVVTATQMLDSMRHSLRPTRAEASDVANAVLDGSDCLLLTAETAVGRYPAQTVKMMERIITRAEQAGRGRLRLEPLRPLPIPLATAHAGCRAAAETDARYLVAFTTSGSTAFQVARFRPVKPILACAPNDAIARRIALTWGVNPVIVGRRNTFEQLIGTVNDGLTESGWAERGDVVVIVSGVPVGKPGTTNTVKIHRIV